MKQLSDVTALVVDDDADITMFLATILEDAGMKVMTAYDGNQALERLRERIPDVISLDLVMPGKSGIRVLHELRKNPAWSRIPVLIVTGHARDPQVRRDLAEVLADSTISGPSAYLDKPVTPEKYLTHVCNAVGLQPPGGVAAGEDVAADALRKEAEALLHDADAGEVEEVLRLLRARHGVTSSH